MAITVSPGPTIPLEACRQAATPFSHEGHSYATWSAGQGPDLLLIHGFPTSSWDWCKLWGPLSWHFTCHAMDMLGFGLSDKPAGYRYRIAYQAKAQVALLRSRNVKEVHILAHDYGDTVAQELLALQREGELEGLRIKSVVFLNGGLFPGVHRPRLIQKLLTTPLGPVIAALMSEGAFRRNFRAIFGANTQPTVEELEGFWGLMNEKRGRRVMPLLIDYMAQRRTNEERWRAPLADPQVPLRLINGADDPISGRHLVEAYNKIVPDADTVLLEGIGHYPQMEAPEGVFDAIMAFHRRLSA
ncbi:MAG: alpha/beta hydrolase [Pseudomonadota bacterium]